MYRQFCVVLCIAIFSACLCSAQSNPAASTFDVEGESVSGLVIVLGNTVNDNFLVFYHYHKFPSTTTSIRCREIKPDGTVGTPRDVVTDTASGMRPFGTTLRAWDVAWSPLAKSYMIVFQKNKTIFARPLRVNGSPSGPAKRISISTYSDDYKGSVHVAWTKKKRFIVVYWKKKKRTFAYLLKKTGAPIKKEKELTPKNNLANYPVEAYSEGNGNVGIIHTSTYTNSSGDLVTRIESIRVDHKLNTLARTINGEMIDDEPTSFVSVSRRAWGTYAPGSGRHFVIWNFQGEDERVIFFDNSHSVLSGPRSITLKGSVQTMFLNPVADQFVIFHTKSFSTPADGEWQELYRSRMSPGGVLGESSVMFRHVDDNIDARGMGMNRSGDTIFIWNEEFEGILRAQIF